MKFTDEHRSDSNTAVNPKLWAKCQAEAKRKFKIHPSAFSNGYASKIYKERGGTWRSDSLDQWFAEDWKAINSSGKIVGGCGDGETKGKVKCLPASKAQSLSKKDRSRLAKRKQSQDPNPSREGAPMMVSSKIDSMNPRTFARAVVSIESKYGLRLDAADLWRRLDGTPCGKGWTGTKPKPGCKRAEGEDDGDDFGDFDFFADTPTTKTPKVEPKKNLKSFSFGKITSAEKSGAKEFTWSYVNGDEGVRGNFGKRIFDNAKKVPGLSEDEAAGLASWLSNGYRDMGKLMRKGTVGYDVPGGDVGVRGALKNADSALRKITPVTSARLKERGQPTGKPLNRFIEVDNPSEFIQRYKDSIGKDFTEPGFFGTSAQPGDSETMKLYSTRANITYKVNANLSGKGQGRYVDHLKGWNGGDHEGEVLYPPNSKFRVKSVSNALSKDEAKEFDKFEKAGGRMASLKNGGPKAYNRYQELAKKFNTYTIEMDEK